MKILFLIRSLDPGGAERQLVLLAKGLKNKGHSVTIVLFYPDNLFQDELKQADIPVISLNKKGRWDVFPFLLHLINILKTFKPDFLHSYLDTSNVLSVLLKLTIPKVKIVWGIRSSNMDLSMYDRLHWISYKIAVHLSKFADKIILNSFSGKDYAEKNGMPANKIIVIPNGIDTKYFCFDTKSGNLMRKEWKIKKNERLIGIAGRLDPMKDHPNFLKAASLLTGGRYNVKFVIIGDGPSEYRKNLQTLGNSLGLENNLIWAAVKTDMPAFYNSLDILCLSSISEGTPNVVGEAMACGVPCVVTDAGDSARLVGDTGIVVEPDDPQALAEGLNEMLTNIFAYKSSLIRQRIKKNYSYQMMIDATEIALLNLL